MGSVWRVESHGGTTVDHPIVAACPAAAPAGVVVTGDCDRGSVSATGACARFPGGPQPSIAPTDGGSWIASMGGTGRVNEAGSRIGRHGCRLGLLACGRALVSGSNCLEHGPNHLPVTVAACRGPGCPAVPHGERHGSTNNGSGLTRTWKCRRRTGPKPSDPHRRIRTEVRWHCLGLGCILGRPSSVHSHPRPGTSTACPRYF